MTIGPPQHHIHAAVRAALEEDLAVGDVTTAALFPEPVRGTGTILARQDMVVAGIAVARTVFEQLDDSLRLFQAVEDGDEVGDGTAVLKITGDARSILMGERVALNFLQHLSGIATLTARLRQAVRAYGTAILDTRKTVPGLRALQKWAVRLGGGLNHRCSLGDGILIKDNHLALLNAQGVSIADACRRARERGPHRHRIIVEVHSLQEVHDALRGGADVILLDNVDPGTVRQAVEAVKGRAIIEVSGGITLANAAEMAAAGAQALSIGALTHSAPAANLSLDLTALKSPSRHRRRLR